MLKGKVALVTGAGSGIGKAIAIKLAQEGVKVAVSSIRESGLQTAEEIKALGGDAMGLVIDVSKEEHYLAAIPKIVAKWGGIDLAVPCAATTRHEVIVKDRDVVTMDRELWDFTIATSITGAMLCCKHVIPEMLKRGAGDIVNISSQTAAVGHDVMTAYACAKAGINHLTKQVATQYGYRNIRCNALGVGFVVSEHISEHFPRAAMEEMRDDQLLPDFSTPEDVANVVAFLLDSDLSRIITAQVIATDRGAFSHAPRHGKGMPFTDTGSDAGN